MNKASIIAGIKHINGFKDVTVDNCTTCFYYYRAYNKCARNMDFQFPVNEHTTCDRHKKRLNGR